MPPSRQALALRAKSLNTLRDIVGGLPIRVDDEQGSWVIRTRADDDVKFASSRYQVAHAYVIAWRSGWVAAFDTVTAATAAVALRHGDR